jgi:hypothetical protein
MYPDHLPASPGYLDLLCVETPNRQLGHAESLDDGEELIRDLNDHGVLGFDFHHLAPEMTR